MAALDPNSDECLMEQAQKGEEEAFLRLYQRYRDPTFRFAYRILGSAEQAEDITQDCFLSLIKNPGSFKAHRGSLRTYLYAAARNLAFKRFRRSEVEVSGGESEGMIVGSGRDEPLREILAAELSGAVRKALDQISPLQREVVVLFEYEEQSLAEIAAIVGADVGTVKSRLYRGRECLRRELAPYLNGNQARQREKS
jgi:RNA polymerase sigma-70 factor (ECF subfamily)